MSQFSTILGKIGKLAKIWAKSFQECAHSSLKNIEKALNFILAEKLTASLIQDEESELGRLLKRKKNLLLLEENIWKLKCRVVWLKKGDSNTKFFHTYAQHRKAWNTIGDIEYSHRVSVFSNEEMVDTRVELFSSLFKETPGCPIAKNIKVIDLFPKKIQRKWARLCWKRYQSKKSLTLCLLFKNL